MLGLFDGVVSFVLAWLLAASVLGFLAVYGLNRAFTQDVVGRNVTVGGVELAQVEEQEADVRVGLRHVHVVLAQRAREDPTGRPEVLQAMLKPVPLRRVGSPDEIYMAVKFIIECDYFTGRCIDVDGGLVL